MQYFESIIIGGGLSGMTTAVSLAQTGIPVALVDKQSAYASAGEHGDGRTTAIAYSSKNMLEALGVWANLDEHAEPILDIRISEENSHKFLHYNHCDVGDHPLGFIVENTLLKKALFNRVINHDLITCFFNKTLDRLTIESAKIIAHLSNGSDIEGHLIVGSDGRTSKVRQLAGIGMTKFSYGQTSMVCTISHDHPHHGIAHERFLIGGPLAILPMQNNHSSIVWTERTEVATALMSLSDENFEYALRARFGDCLGKMTIVDKRSSFPLSMINVETQVSDRVALVGDSAHGLHPIAGQGFNLGVRDIASLAQEIATAKRLGLDAGNPEALRRFNVHRRPENLAMVLATDSLNRLFSNNNKIIRCLRSTGLNFVNQSTPVKKLLMRHAMGILGQRSALLNGLLP